MVLAATYNFVLQGLHKIWLQQLECMLFDLAFWVGCFKSLKKCGLQTITNNQYILQVLKTTHVNIISLHNPDTDYS
jgi:hypothetical protein